MNAIEIIMAMEIEISFAEIARLQPTDVKLIKHGHWDEGRLPDTIPELKVTNYADFLECSECGCMCSDTRHPPKFCDRCGAKMDGEDGEDK